MLYFLKRFIGLTLLAIYSMVIDNEKHIDFMVQLPRKMYLLL